MSAAETDPTLLAPELVKACCVNTYESDLVAMLLGESYHPGGVELTRRLAGRVLDIRPDQRVVDVASGQGTTALLLADEFDAQVTGVDLSPVLIEASTELAVQRGLSDRVEFRLGDAESLPLADGEIETIICECAFCTFPDKATAAREFARALAPGGRLGLTDVVLEPAELPESLRTLTGWVSCLADARPTATYVELLENAGLVVERSERHDAALATMVDRIDARLRVLRMTGAVDGMDLDIDLALTLVADARSAVDDGVAGYVLLTARKPA